MSIIGMIVWFMGSILVFVGIHYWNKAINHPTKGALDDEKDDYTVSIYMAFILAAMSWGAIIGAIVIAIVGFTIFVIGTSKTIDKLNVWYKANNQKDEHGNGILKD